MRQHPGRAASRGKLPARMIISVIYRPCPIWSGAFYFLCYLRLPMGELVEGAAVGLKGGGRRGL